MDNGGKLRIFPRSVSTHIGVFLVITLAFITIIVCNCEQAPPSMPSIRFSALEPVIISDPPPEPSYTPTYTNPEEFRPPPPLSTIPLIPDAEEMDEQ